MGAYGNIYLGDFELGYTRNYVDLEITNLFRTEDKKTFSINDPELPEIYKHHEEDHLDREDFTITILQIPVNILKDRLEILGYSFESSKIAFTEWVKLEIEYLKNFKDNLEDSLYNEEKIKFLEKLTVELWIEKITFYYNNRKAERYYDNFWEENWFGFGGEDLNVTLRIAIEVIGNNQSFTYDLTSLILNEFLEEAQDIVDSSNDLKDGYVRKYGKIIILTEGKSDSWILSKSLALLFPHLYRYYTFLDFEHSNLAGGVGYLTSTVKSFIGAGILNKVIALFDNDTAAKSAIKGLSKSRLPTNIKILQLPHNKLLESYPTIGPNGTMFMNVNGLAGSIETFLGITNLKDKDGSLFPIQWMGYDQTTKSYQGEILNKNDILLNFKKQIETCEKDSLQINNYDWEALRNVLNSIFIAFQSVDANNIIPKRNA
ncbi:HEPN/Toprim-associated domain-containing protein [Leptospira interrogans]|uniref:HEPN/Toprim N-terminal domain-containing protein n=1 Tax=Leptospira interrogans serovar Bataviae TaxID=312175 RepID=A0AAP9WP60_LEPIR|nr:HEPN/Toprim-associated domain-containing protein [Leptospira interrogans]QOI53011.1 hypothetical protein Lepto1489_21800 [Leptospira interrogans serovar Bataviae]WOT13123.1 HEPN/Toprim-associated domain-containing protein [Leptospira interrogans]